MTDYGTPRPAPLVAFERLGGVDLDRLERGLELEAVRGVVRRLRAA